MAVAAELAVLEVPAAPRATLERRRPGPATVEMVVTVTAGSVPVQATQAVGVVPAATLTYLAAAVEAAMVATGITAQSVT